MRSQTSKSPPKKGAQNKTSVAKAPKPGKKKSITTSKVKKNVKKSPSKSSKKSDSKSNSLEKQNDGNNPENKINANTVIASTSSKTSTKSSSSRGNSPTKKVKTEIKEKKETPKLPPETTKKSSNQKVANDSAKTEKKSKPKTPKKKSDSDSDSVKYKINSDTKKSNIKFSKAKNVKKGQKKTINKSPIKSVQKESVNVENNKNEQRLNITTNSDSAIVNKNDKSGQKNVADVNEKNNKDNSSSSNLTKSNTPPSAEPAERPPKFFTSSRSPRMVDIDVKCCKNSKGNLSVSERFVSMKSTESKSENINKDKSNSSALVSQGPEIDVYTFTEKVDSPKSILPEFRNTTNKNINRVRPIARVKGTIIDKNKADSERKKYSPHRPIEEVVKQLKANKRCEELNTTQPPTLTTSVVSTPSTIKSDEEEKPKPIVSKSYKMVARKSSIPGKPFSPIKFLEQETSTSSSKDKPIKTLTVTKKTTPPLKKKSSKIHISDEEIETSKFSLNTNSNVIQESSSDGSDNDDAKESSESETLITKTKAKKYKRKKESPRKKPVKEHQQPFEKPIEMIQIKEEPISDDEYEQPSKRRQKLISMWNGPKQHRMASLNALAKVHCLYENESRTHMELGLMKTVDRPVAVAGCSTAKPAVAKKKEDKPPNIEIKQEYNSESEYESPVNYVMDSSEEDLSPPNTRTLRGVTGMRSAGKYWDLRTSSSEDSETDYNKKSLYAEKKKTPIKVVANKSEQEKPPAKVKKLSPTPRKKRNRNEVVMDLKDMVVQKRMASLNASAILAASYEKRSPKSSKDDTTSDSCSDESYFHKSKNGVSSGVKSEAKIEEPKKEVEDATGDKQQKMEVIVNQDTDVTITGVYSTHHHEGFCTVSGMQYRISSTSLTQTTATSNCEKEECAQDEGTARYTPLSALSSMQPPLESQQQPAQELGNLTRRSAGCSSAFTAPPPAPHHDPGKPSTSGLGMFESPTMPMTAPTGYYQPAGPLIKESNEAERSLARYHPAPHYHAPHPPVIQQYASPYYPDLCYGRYYRPPGPYHMPPPPPNPDPQMVGVGNEPYTPPPYYSGPPCYQHSPQRVPYIEYRGCPCPINTSCPKNVLIGPATGKAPTGGGPDVASSLTQPGGTFRTKVRASCADHGSGKDPPAAADAPRPFAAEGEPGPPSPARGSAGACPPQPPTVAPRRARLGKAMARRSLADTGALMQTARAPTEDDDVLAISPPISAPIDLSSSDETAPPKRRLSKLEIDVGDDAEESRETNGIGEHVKLQKRRKVLPEKIEVSNNNVVNADKALKKKSPLKVKKTPAPSPEKKFYKRKADNLVDPLQIKKALIEASPVREPPQINYVTPLCFKEQINTKPKSALVLDDLIKKNSVDRPDAKFHSVDDVDPVELFLSPSEQAKQNEKPALNINNNIVENNNIPVNGARSKTIAAVTQHISKKLASPTKIMADPEKEFDKPVNTTLPVKPVLKTTEKIIIKESDNIINNITDCQATTNKAKIAKPEKVSKSKSMTVNNVRKNKINAISDKLMNEKTQKSALNAGSSDKLIYSTKTKTVEQPEPAPVEVATTKPLDTPENLTENNNKIDKEYAEKDSKEKPQTAGKIVKRSKLSIDKPDLKEKCSKNLSLKFPKKPVIKADETTSVVEEACGSPVSAKTVRRRRRRSGACLKRARRVPTLVPPPMCLSDRAPSRWSNGWRWDGEHFLSKIYVNNDSRLDRMAHCWPRMHHASGDQVSRGDCVLLRASPAKAQPFVARVAHLWENPEDGEMMVSLVWYYRPEHTERGRGSEDAPDEVFASRHRDANSVACIEDKCYVLTYNEYCRYRKKLKAIEEGITIPPSIVPPMPASEVFPAVATNDARLPPTVSPELVLFCRKIYDFRSKKIQDGTRSRVAVLKN